MVNSSLVDVNKKLSKTPIIVSFLLLITPSLIAFQPVFHKDIQNILLSLRYVIFPCYIFYALKNECNFKPIALFFLYVTVLNIFSPSYVNFQHYYLTILCLFSSIAFFKFGHHLTKFKYNNSVLHHLGFGTAVFNILTILLYNLLLSGFIDLVSFYEAVVNLDQIHLGTNRFSIGNAIEIPYVMSCLLYGAIILSANRYSFLIPSFLNLITAIIAQSRVVLLLSFFIFFFELLKSNWKVRIAAVIILFIAIPFVLYEFESLFDSLINRAEGNDAGSKDERTAFLDIFLANLTIDGFLLGKGMTASAMLLYQKIGIYRTIESFLMEMIYDVGIVGISLFMLSIYTTKRTIIIPSGNIIILSLIILQLLFFLPIFTMMPFVFFTMGVLSKPINSFTFVKKF